MLNPMTRSLWLGLEQQFVSNCETHTLILDIKYRNFIQGDLSISDYCHRLNGMTDALGDLGEIALDRSLAALLKWQHSFPTFA
jgi:hypothetical protein